MGLTNERQKLRKLQTWIREEPRRYNQDVYLEIGSKSRMVNAQKPPCGTVCCLAGAACMMEGLKPYNESGNESSFDFVWVRDRKQTISAAAQNILDLSDRQRINLFRAFGDGWSDVAYIAYSRAFTQEERVEAACMAIDELIAEGGS